MIFNKSLLIKAATEMEQDSFDLVALLKKYTSTGSIREDNPLKPVDCFEVVRLISLVSGYSEEQLKSKRRFQNLADWRHVAMFLIYSYSSLTYQRVGDIFNTKHDNVIYACKRVKDATDGFNNDLDLKFRIAEQVFKTQFNIF